MGITNQKVTEYGYYTSTIGRMVAVGSLGLPGAQKPRRKRKRSFWKPDMDEYDWEEFNKRNGR